MRKKPAVETASLDELNIIRRTYQRSLPEPWRRTIRKKLKGLRKASSKKRNHRSTKNASQKDPIPGMIAEAKRLLADWQLEACSSLLEKALEIEPDHRRALQLYSTVLGHLGKKEESLATANKIIELYPVDVPGRRQLKALGVKPLQASRGVAVDVLRSQGFTAYGCLDCAAYLYDAELFEEAIEFCDIGLSVVATSKIKKESLTRARSELRLKKAMAFEAKNDIERAESLYRELLSMPNIGKKAAEGLARCHLEEGRAEQAELLLEAAGNSGPGKFSILMLEALQAQGKLLESYMLYRNRPVSYALSNLRKNHASSLEINLCDPGNVNKSILLISEGGPGDEIRFSTIYRDLASHFSHTIVTCDPRLESIMKRSFPEISFSAVPRLRREYVVGAGDRKNLPSSHLFHCVSDLLLDELCTVDITCSVLDSLADIRPDLAAFENTISCLRPLNSLRGHWANSLSVSGKMKVGLTWRSMLLSVARNRHYLTVDELQPLKELSNCEFWILQPGVTQEEITKLSEFIDIRVPEGLDLVDDFEGQIALASCLDYVISPFTTTGELAGACGVPTILLSTTRNTQWRRKADGGDIWHPSAKIVTCRDTNSKQKAVEEAVRIIRENQSADCLDKHDGYRCYQTGHEVTA